jgi:general secretion pathway protein N
MRQGRVLGSVGALVFVAVAVATLPASLVLGRLPPELRFEGASGSVWKGEADSIALRGVPLGAISWRSEPGALLSGQLAYRIVVTRPDGAVRGRIAAGFGGVVTATAVELKLPINALTPGFAENGWRGVVEGTVGTARLERGWPVALAAHLTLRNLSPPSSALTLGSYALEFDEGASTPQQLVGRLRDIEAPLTVRAQLLIRRDRSYTLEGEVTPRPGTPPEVNNAIAFLGLPDAAGRRAFTITGTF